MSDKIHNVLFICTHNAARSIMAEGLMNHLAGGRFKAWSAGSQPSGTVHPFALQILAALKVPTAGFRSKSWDEFGTPDAPVMDFVFTVCDDAAGEVCPVWPSHTMTAHWGVRDPLAFDGSDEDRATVFMDAAVTLRRRIELMLALPIASLDRLSLQREVTDFGRR